MAMFPQEEIMKPQTQHKTSNLKRKHPRLEGEHKRPSSAMSELITDLGKDAYQELYIRFDLGGLWTFSEPRV